MRLSRKGIHPAGVVPFLFQITVVIIAPQARHDERMSCSFRNNRRTEAHYNSVCRRPGIRVPGILLFTGTGIQHETNYVLLDQRIRQRKRKVQS